MFLHLGHYFLVFGFVLTIFIYYTSIKHFTDKGSSKYRTYDQFVTLTFGQLNKCQSLNDISAGIGVSETFIKDLGLTQIPARSTISDGNKNRDWHVFESLYYRLLSHYKSVHNPSSITNYPHRQSAVQSAFVQFQ